MPLLKPSCPDLLYGRTVRVIEPGRLVVDVAVGIRGLHVHVTVVMSNFPGVSEAALSRCMHALVVALGAKQVVIKVAHETPEALYGEVYLNEPVHDVAAGHLAKLAGASTALLDIGSYFGYLKERDYCIRTLKATLNGGVHHV